MATKIGGILLIILGIYLFKLGISYEDKDSFHLINVKLIGSSILLFIGGIVLMLTSSTMCEIFGVFC